MHDQRIPIIGGNWKMHLALSEALQLAAEVRNRLAATRGVEVVLFPPAPFLQAVAERLDGTPIAVGGQDLHPETKGAFTGAVAGPMLASVGCTHVLVGHSERRAVFGDSDAVVARKLAAALGAGLRPILCVGEDLAQRQAGETFAVVARQLQAALAGIGVERLGHLVLAYEPVWAIGTGLTASPAQAQEVHGHLRQVLTDLHGGAFARTVRIQYGGSVKGQSAPGLMAQPDIDGLLVGGASLQIEDFVQIVRFRQAH